MAGPPASSSPDRGLSIAGRSISPRVIARLDHLDREEREIGVQLEDPATLADHRASRDLAVKRAAVRPAAERYRSVLALAKEIDELRGAIASGQDRDFVELAKAELPELEARAGALLDEMLAALVHSEDRQIGSVMMELRMGTGGDEAALWCRDLMEMYTRYSSKKGWACELLDVALESDAGGVRNCVMNIRGEGVWSELAFEAGVHSVKRVPATEAQGRIHTSTASVAVLPEPEQVNIKIDWANDVEENVTTSQGPGGQNVNKVATAVQLHHKPSGILIRMQESKSQQQNRAMAKRLLLTKLYDIEQRKKHQERAAARKSQIGSGDRSEKIRTYRWKEGIVADERLPGEYSLRDVMSGDLSRLMKDLLEHDTRERLEAL
jgi:peptide chain release factor 1